MHSVAAGETLEADPLEANANALRDMAYSAASGVSRSLEATGARAYALRYAPPIA